MINPFRSRALRHGVSIPVLLASAAVCQGCANSGGPREFFARLWNRDTVDHAVAVNPPEGAAGDTSDQHAPNPILSLLKERPAPEDPFLNRYDQVVFDHDQSEVNASSSRQADVQSGDLTAGEIAVGLEQVSIPTTEHDATPMPPRPPYATAAGHRVSEQHAAAPFRNPFARKQQTGSAGQPPARTTAASGAAASQPSPNASTTSVKAPPVGAGLDAELSRLQTMLNTRPETAAPPADNVHQQRATRLRIDELMETSRDLAENGENRDAYYVALEAQELQQQTGVVFEFGTQSPADLVAELRTKLHADTPVVEISLFGDSDTGEMSPTAQDAGDDSTVDLPSFAAESQQQPARVAGPFFAAPGFGSSDEELAGAVPDPADLETPAAEEIQFRPPTEFLRGPDIGATTAAETAEEAAASRPDVMPTPSAAVAVSETPREDTPAQVALGAAAPFPVDSQQAEETPFARIPTDTVDVVAADSAEQIPGGESSSVEAAAGPAPFPEFSQPNDSVEPAVPAANPFTFPGLADNSDDRVEFLEPAPENPIAKPTPQPVAVQEPAETLPRLNPGVPARLASSRAAEPVVPGEAAIDPAPSRGLPVIRPRWSRQTAQTVSRHGSLIMPKPSVPALADPDSAPAAVLPKPVQTAEVPQPESLQLPSSAGTPTSEAGEIAFSEADVPVADSGETGIAPETPELTETVSAVPTLLTPTFEGAPGETHLSNRRRDGHFSGGPPLLVAPNASPVSDALVSNSRTFLPLRRNAEDQEQAELEPTSLETIDWDHETESRASAATPWFRHPLVIIGALALVAVGISIRMHRRGVLAPQTERARVLKWPFGHRTADSDSGTTAGEEPVHRRKSA